MHSQEAPFVVQSHRGEYVVQRAGLADALAAGLSPLDRLIVDRNVLDLHPTIALLASDEQTYSVTADESLKSLDGVTPILSWILETGFSRSGALYVVGGGTVQDAGSFVASILHRGARWVYVPTTLLAQGDSCIGSKSSLNFLGYKNQLGTFYPPSRIIVDDRFLHTLASQEIRAGVGEMLHYAVLGDEEVFSAFEDALVDTWERLAPADMSALAMRALRVKREFIEADEFDADVRKNLNFGHTFAHGLEFASEGQIPHGIAVAYGIDLANAYALEQGILDLGTSVRVAEVVHGLVDGCELGQVTGVGVLAGMSRDKKRSQNGVELILIEGLGKPLRATVPLDEHLGLFLERYLARW